MKFLSPAVIFNLRASTIPPYECNFDVYASDLRCCLNALDKLWRRECRLLVLILLLFLGPWPVDTLVFILFASFLCRHSWMLQRCLVQLDSEVLLLWNAFLCTAIWTSSRLELISNSDLWNHSLILLLTSYRPVAEQLCMKWTPFKKKNKFIQVFLIKHAKKILHKIYWGLLELHSLLSSSSDILSIRKRKIWCGNVTRPWGKRSVLNECETLKSHAT